jgi:hypothetical protein
VSAHVERQIGNVDPLCDRGTVVNLEAACAVHADVDAFVADQRAVADDVRPDAPAASPISVPALRVTWPPFWMKVPTLPADVPISEFF